jgi:single-stranded-DNA-specific exonuclease
MSLDDDLSAARRFLDEVDPTTLWIYADFDADGLAAAATLSRALSARYGTAPRVVIKRRGEPAWSDAARDRIASLQPGALVLADLGVQRPGFLDGRADEVPVLYLDHHVPSGRPDRGVVVTGHGLSPSPCTAWLAYELVRPWLDDGSVPPERLPLWVPAIGVLSDMGDKAPWPHMAALRKAFRITHVREAKVLVNASRRASSPLGSHALQALLTAEQPRDIASDALSAAREEVKAALASARRVPPRFAKGTPWALVPVHSRCQVHPLIAQQWAGRLPKYLALSTNPDYLDGYLSFSVRTRRDDDIPARLRALPLADAHRDRFGHGHPQASGGSLPLQRTAELLAALGFDDDDVTAALTS